MWQPGSVLSITDVGDETTQLSLLGSYLTSPTGGAYSLAINERRAQPRGRNNNIPV